jgi:hypothetical protein
MAKGDKVYLFNESNIDASEDEHSMKNKMINGISLTKELEGI